MGRRGKKPRPSAVKAAECTIEHVHISTCFSDRRPLNDKEPKPPDGTPRPPAFLNDLAREKWHETVPILQHMGVLSMADGDVLTAYCVAWARAVQAEQQVSASVVTTTGKGNEKSHPAVNVALRSWTEVRRFGAELGLTPSARSRLQIPTPLPPGSSDGKEQEEKPIAKQDKFFRTSNHRE